MNFSWVISLVIVFVCWLFSVSQGLDLCDSVETDSNLTFYKDPKIQNCGCKSNLCIRKCCKAGFYLGKKRTCRRVNSSDPFDFPAFKKRTTFSRTVTNNDNFTVGVLECRYFKLNKDDPNDTYFLQENGLLWVPYHKSGIYYENTDYCIDELDGNSVFACFAPDNILEIIGVEVNAYGMIITNKTMFKY